MTLTLHGLPASGYYNVVKLALLEKGINFQEAPLNPGEKTAEFLAMSPMGKIPVLETPDGPISESQAILRYLEALQPQPALFPSQPMRAARATQIQCFLDLYVMRATGPLVPQTFFGAPADAGVVETSRQLLNQSMTALAQIVRIEPFIAGPELTHADFSAVIMLDLTVEVFRRVGIDNPTTALMGYADYRARMAARPSFTQTLAARDGMLAEIDASAA